MSRQYLGDGLYADYDGYQVELVTNNGVEDQDSVFLDPTVFGAFLSYLIRIGLIKDPNGE